MLVVDKNLETPAIVLRSSMRKYPGANKTLRVVQAAQSGSVSLNHEILCLLGPHVSRDEWRKVLQLSLAKFVAPLLGNLERDQPLLDRFQSAVSSVLPGLDCLRRLYLNPFNDPLMLEFASYERKASKISPSRRRIGVWCSTRATWCVTSVCSM